jgi:glycosyltransferase involved in cell wall biosynthesis
MSVAVAAPAKEWVTGSTAEPIRVGLNYLLANPLYQAGKVYSKGLLRAVRNAAPGRVQVHLLAPVLREYIEDDEGPLIDAEVVRPPIHRFTRDWILDRIGERLLQRDLLRERALKEHGIQVILFGDAPAGSGIPSIGWAADFQHRHLPEFFNQAEIDERDRAFDAIASRSARVLLLSNSVKADVERFFPRHAAKVRVVPPVSLLPSTPFAEDPRSTSARYDLPERFIYLPNQFWRHKNHAVVWEALRLLKAQGREVFVACTGYPVDQRDAAHFDSVLGTLARYGLRSQVALLGSVPRNDVVQLLRQSLCMLNPSLFEGYGLSVDEARSCGKPILISDIPSHREQQAESAVYFDPRDPKELATKLDEMWTTSEPGPDPDREAAGRAEMRKRAGTYGHQFLGLLEEVTR